MDILNITTEMSQDERLKVWKELAEQILISVYVPEVEQMTHEQALALALERDLQSALELASDAQLHLEDAAAEALKD